MELKAQEDKPCCNPKAAERIHSMELKGAVSVGALNKDLANPFNGIERSESNADSKRQKLNKNPFNGIERRLKAFMLSTK